MDKKGQLLELWALEALIVKAKPPAVRNVIDTSGSRPFHIVERSGSDKGRVLVASRPIKTGELILAEEAMLKMRYPERPGDKVAELQRTLSALSPEDKKLFEELHIYTVKLHKGGHRLEHILLSNGVPVTSDQLHGEQGIFPKFSWISLSCAPNTHYYWQADLELLLLFATQDIQQGELLTTYRTGNVRQDRSRESRHENIRKWYGLDECRCTLCSMPPAAIATSDARREQTRRMHQSMLTSKDPWVDSEMVSWRRLELDAGDCIP